MIRHPLSGFAAGAEPASPSQPSVEGGARLGTAASMRGGPSSLPLSWDMPVLGGVDGTGAMYNLKREKR